jgi:hypothetical protein
MPITMIEKVCEGCGKPYQVPKCKDGKRKTCSLACKSEMLRKIREAKTKTRKKYIPHPDRLITLTCPVCQKEFVRQKCREKESKTCSYKCNGKLNAVRKTDRKPKPEKKAKQKVQIDRDPKTGREMVLMDCAYCTQPFKTAKYRAFEGKCCSISCGMKYSAVKKSKDPKRLLKNQIHRGQKSRAGDDARLKRHEPDKLPTKPVDTVTPWYRDPSAPGNKLVQTKNPKPGYIPLNRNSNEGTDSM